jgi:hypothetical protein
MEQVIEKMTKNDIIWAANRVRIGMKKRASKLKTMLACKMITRKEYEYLKV